MKSDQVKKGVERAPHRSLFNALGMTEEELDRPLIGVVNSYNEIVPGHMNLDKIAEAVKKGIYLAGGTPVEMCIRDSVLIKSFHQLLHQLYDVHVYHLNHLRLFPYTS